MKRLLRAALVCFCFGATACCVDVLDCSGSYLFQKWEPVAYTSLDGGTAAGMPVPFLDLRQAHYGPGQPFYIGGCSYQIDIETNTTESSGSFAFSHPDPQSTECISHEGTETYSLSCDSLVVTSSTTITTFHSDPGETPDAGSSTGPTDAN